MNPLVPRVGQSPFFQLLPFRLWHFLWEWSLQFLFLREFRMKFTGMLQKLIKNKPFFSIRFPPNPRGVNKLLELVVRQVIGKLIVFSCNPIQTELALAHTQGF